jgi:hypothetical protein
VVRSHQKTLYPILFNTSAAALQKLAHDPRFIGGQVGMIGILHTWDRKLGYHPHIHYLVPGGGLSDDHTRWIPARKNFLVHVEPLSILFRAKFRDELKSTALYEHLPKEVWEKNWVVHSEPVGSGIEALKYLAPYVFRVAISNNRLISIDNNQVSFRYQDSKTKQCHTLSLSALEFIRRFLQHVLPKGFIKVRYYGLLNPAKRHLLALVRYLLQAFRSIPYATFLPRVQLLCPKCGRPMRLLGRIPYPSRGPPHYEAT